MSFFGFETSVPKQEGANQSYAEEDIEVYTWGESSYNTLGNALEEAGDDLNDETFGAEPVGKDFDFSGNSASIMRSEPGPPLRSTAAPTQSASLDRSSKPAHADLWASKDPTAGLLKYSSTARTDTQPQQHVPPSQAPSVFALLESSVAPAAERRHSHQAAPIASMPLAEPPRQPDVNTIKPRTMAEIEAEMQAALRQQQLMAQQQEYERRQAEQQLLREQLLQQEERRLFEQQRQQALQQQAMQDPLRAIRQAMGEPNDIVLPIHEKRPSITSSGSPLTQHRHTMSASHSMQPVPMGTVPPTQQEMMLQELLYQQQQQQQRFLQQRAQAQQHGFDLEKNDAPIMSAEAQLRMQEAEAKHRRRIAKIQSMARYNDLMTQSDKDFITRVQVAQLVTSDPYAEDFYAQVYASIRQQRNSVDSNAGSGPNNAGGPKNRPQRRENAIQRMQAQVERLVNNMKSRELSKENSATPAALQNALGKTSGRTYRAAPRQLLQVAIASPESQKAHPVKEHVPEKVVDNSHGHGELPPPFSHAEGLLIVERLFTNILDIEQLRRNRPPVEDTVGLEAWNEKLQELLDVIWKGLRVSGPLYETNPHPFIALITPLKGKRFIGRLGRDLTDAQKLMALSVIVNRIEQVDVIRHAAILDSVEDSRDRRLVEKQAFAFQEHVVNQGLQLSPTTRTLKTYTNLIGLMMENGAVFARVVITKPGLILLEHFFAEASLLKHGLQGPDGEPIPPPPEDVANWSSLYDRLFEHLLPLWTIMFPSSRILPAFPPDSLESIQVSLVTDGFDQHIWRFLAGFALEGTQDQHSKLVTQLRAKVMGTLKMAQRLEEGKAKVRKIRNVDLFLNALGLSSSQIPVQ